MPSRAWRRASTSPPRSMLLPALVFTAAALAPTEGGLDVLNRLLPQRAPTVCQSFSKASLLGDVREAFGFSTSWATHSMNAQQKGVVSPSSDSVLPPLYPPPNTESFNAVLGACSKASPNPATVWAVAVYDDMEEKGVDRDTESLNRCARACVRMQHQNMF